MEIKITYVIILITSIISIYCFNKADVNNKLMFSPYRYINDKKRWIILSHGFIHADFFHLFFNMYVLYVFAPSVESYFNITSEIGYIYFISLYILGILFSTIPSLFKHHDNPNYFSLGASGAVSSIVFAYILIFPLRELGLVLLPGIWLPGFIFGSLYLIAEHYLSKKQYSNIAHDAHLSGAIFGIIFIILYDFNNVQKFIQKIAYYFSTF